jgi:SNF2 family DNA or RNA helicase
MAPPLFKHQKQSIAFLAKHYRAMDMSDPGTGKTRIEAEEFAARRRRKGGKAFIVAPKSLLKSAWKADFKKYAPDMVVVTVEAQGRTKAMQEIDGADVVVINTDAVKFFQKLPPSFFRPFDTLIIDESTSFKHHTSARSRALNYLKRYFKWRRAMSGTAISNSVLDIWHQMFILDDGRRLGDNFTKFRSSISTLELMGPNSEKKVWVPKDTAKEIITHLIGDITIRHKFEDCVDIPPNHTYIREFELNAKHRAYYDELLHESILLHKQKKITAVNAAVLRGKLLQAASGSVYSEDREIAVLDSDRNEMVIELVEERDHSLVFFSWAHQRNQLIELAEARGIRYALIDGSITSGREEIVDDFQKGFYQVLFAHPASAGHGLTLTKATATIWASPIDNLEHFLQANRRIYRIGQTKATETIAILAEDTFDHVAWNNCQGKGEVLKSFLEYLEVKSRATPKKNVVRPKTQRNLRRAA